MNSSEAATLSRSGPWLSLSALIFACALGCSPKNASYNNTSNGAGDPEVTPPAQELPGGVSRFRRLTHAQWENTVQDLFGFDEAVGLSSSFRADPTQSGYLFEGNGDALEVDQALWASYQTASATLAKSVVDDSAALARILPLGSAGIGSDAEARQFIEAFGKRVHRRPLTSDQLDAYMALYQQGLTSYEDTPDYRGGVRLVLEAFLQSPYFLYRVEESSAVSAGRIALDGYERASRLSYFLWGTMPDDELFAAADAGRLADAAGVRVEAERLIQHERAADVFVNFFDRVLEVERYEIISPSTTQFPDVSADLAEFAKQETHHFILREMFEKAGSLRDLLTSTTTYVNAELAAIYGLSGSFDEAFREVSLDPGQRRGVLTHVGFLASHSTSREPDPIHRGVFVARRLNCLPISAPPDDIPPLPPSDASKSNRQLVAEHTESVPSCRTCHGTLINPFGFAYEHYDALGAYREMDGSHQVDASVVVPLSQGDVQVANALELAEAMAESPGVHECVSGHLVSFALGRPGVEADSTLVSELGALSLGQAVPFAELMVEMSVAVVSLNRAPEAQ